MSKALATEDEENLPPSSRARSPRRRRFERDSPSSSPSTHLLGNPPSCCVYRVSTVCSTSDDDLKLASFDGNLSECLLPSVACSRFSPWRSVRCGGACRTSTPFAFKILLCSSCHGRSLLIVLVL